MRRARGHGAMQSSKDTVNRMVGSVMNEAMHKLFISSQISIETRFSFSLNIELFLESDADEQLILSIAFNQKSKINAIVIKGPADGSGPKSIKLYANRPSFGFSDVGSVPPSQEIELTDAQLAGEAVSLKFVKFQSVVYLSIFVESNQGGEEVTKVSKIQAIGSTGEGDKFNVNKIKQVDKEQRNK